MIELSVVALWCLVTGSVAVFFLRRRLLLLRLLAVLAVLLLNGFLFLELISSRTFQIFGEVMRPPETEERVIALTFDDGPTRRYTDGILELLDKHEVRATFFLTGREIEQNPHAARAIAAAGHEIGNHSWSHPRMVGVSPSFVREEIELTDRAIRKTGYRGPILFRSPYGKRFIVLPWYLARTGRPNVFWDIEPESDAKLAANHQAIAQHVISKARPGSIVLLHVMYPVREESRKALPEIITGLRARGYRFVTVSELRELAVRPSSS